MDMHKIVAGGKARHLRGDGVAGTPTEGNAIDVDAVVEIVRHIGAAIFERAIERDHITTMPPSNQMFGKALYNLLHPAEIRPVDPGDL